MRNASLIAASLIGATCSASALAQTCKIVLGNTWALALSVPHGWLSACGPEAPRPTAILLWTGVGEVNDAEALMYVTSSPKAEVSLSLFVEGSQKAFVNANPQAKLLVLSSPNHRSFPNAQLVRIGNSGGGREELVAYLEGPDSYFTVAVSAVSSEALERRAPDFHAFLQSLLPMRRQ